jgi:hypothetical protein
MHKGYGGFKNIKKNAFKRIQNFIRFILNKKQQWLGH